MVKVLIIEDDELILKLYQQVFNSEGYDVLSATNGEEGIKVAEETIPDLILLDIMMPKLNGLDMLKKLKSIPIIADTPVIILSNLVGKEYTDAALKAGAIDYFIKSDYDPREIVKITQEVFAKTKQGGK